MNKVFYEQDLINPGVWADIFKESEDLIEAASDAQGINLSPLFHFWGLSPSEELAAELMEEYGVSMQICEMLQHYKTVVPKTVEALQDYYNNLNYQNAFRFGIYFDEFESENYFEQMQAQIDFLLDTYGPCQSTETEQEIKDNISVFPNPTAGLVNIHSENKYKSENINL